MCCFRDSSDLEVSHVTVLRVYVITFIPNVIWDLCVM